MCGYNNNNNNKSTTMFMVLSSWQSHCESSPGSFDECRMAPRGRRPKTKPDDLGCESACTGCQKLHPPSPFIITQPESSWVCTDITAGCIPFEITPPPVRSDQELVPFFQKIPPRGLVRVRTCLVGWLGSRVNASFEIFSGVANLGGA